MDVTAIVVEIFLVFEVNGSHNFLSCSVDSIKVSPFCLHINMRVSVAWWDLVVQLL